MAYLRKQKDCGKVKGGKDTLPFYLRPVHSSHFMFPKVSPTDLAINEVGPLPLPLALCPLLLTCPFRRAAPYTALRTMSDPTPSALQTGALAHRARSVLAPVYHNLSTDFYPWAEVIADLKARSQAGESLLFQAESRPVTARFVWRSGQLLGGHSGPRLLNFAALMRGLPHARVTLLSLSPEAATVMWEQREAEGATSLRGTAAEVAAQLGGKTGLLLCDPSVANDICFWEAGEPRYGYWNPAGEAQDWRFVALAQPLDRGALVMFWSQLLLLTHRRAALDEAWRQVSLALAGDYPVLDPFTREITVKTGELQVDPAVSAEELQPALLAAYAGTLQRLGLRLSDLNVEGVRTHEMWEPSGLLALEGGRL